MLYAAAQQLAAIEEVKIEQAKTILLDYLTSLSKRLNEELPKILDEMSVYITETAKNDTAG